MSYQYRKYHCGYKTVVRSSYLQNVIFYTGQMTSPDNKVNGANMGPIWGRQDPGGPNGSPMNFAIWVFILD